MESLMVRKGPLRKILTTFGKQLLTIRAGGVF